MPFDLRRASALFSKGRLHVLTRNTQGVPIYVPQDMYTAAHSGSTLKEENECSKILEINQFLNPQIPACQVLEFLEKGTETTIPEKGKSSFL